jgi:hypothetical protein
MTSWMRRLAGIAAFALVFLAVKSRMDQRAAPGGERASPAVPEGRTRFVPAQSPSDGFDLQKQNEAADAFFAFYFINTRARRDLCMANGVDIRAFVDAFARVHAAEYAQAKALYQKSGASEEAAYTAMKPSLPEMVSRDMRDIASAEQIGEACRLLAADADALATEMHLSKLQPAVFEALSAGK